MDNLFLVMMQLVHSDKVKGKTVDPVDIQIVPQCLKVQRGFKEVKMYHVTRKLNLGC